MPQSILILAAAIILGILGLSRHQARAEDDRASMVREVEAAALSVAERWSSHVRDLAFDEADVGAREVRVRNDDTGLSTSLGPDAGEDGSDPRTFDDVDDFSGYTLRETTPVGRGVETVAFDVEVSAEYANPVNWQTASSPTTAKQVTVSVREVASGERGRPLVRVAIPVRLTPAHQFAHR